jgi:hypothetical protein
MVLNELEEYDYSIEALYKFLPFTLYFRSWLRFTNMMLHKLCRSVVRHSSGNNLCSWTISDWATIPIRPSKKISSKNSLSPPSTPASLPIKNPKITRSSINSEKKTTKRKISNKFSSEKPILAKINSSLPKTNSINSKSSIKKNCMA